MAANNEVDIKVKYIPDTSALKSAFDEVQKKGLRLNFKGADAKKEIVAPVQDAMKEFNRALSSGDSSIIIKAFDKINLVINETKSNLLNIGRELDTAYKNEGNQALLQTIQKAEKELSKKEKEIAAWNDKFSNSKMNAAKEKAGVRSASEGRAELKKVEDALKTEQSLTAEQEKQYKNLQAYINLLDERGKATSKTQLESDAFDLKNTIKIKGADAYTSEQYSFDTQALENFKSQVNSLGTTSTNTANTYQKDVIEINNANEQLRKEGEKTLTRFGDVFAGTFLGTSLSQLLQTGLQRGVQFFKEYDATLTRTMMVTGMTRDEVDGLTESYNNLANQLSSTTKDVAAAQLVFYQQGLGTQEALKMTEASIAISKTGGIEASEAADRLTAAIRGYQLAADDAMDIADKMSALDAAAASSVDELTIAMQKSASQARMAGLDLDYYMAYLSTMQEVTREAPENIGTAMKSITSRLQEIKDIGKIEEDGTTFSNVAKALNSVGISAVNSSGQLRDLQDIMDDLGPMWATLDKNHKAYLATVLAGNRQQSRFIALMDNYDRALELVDVSQNANGETAKQLRAYNQGLEASFTRLNNAWQQFATGLADSDMIKDVVDLLSKFIEWINGLPSGIKKATAGILLFTKVMSALSKVTAAGSGNWLLKITGLDTFVSPIEEKDLKKMNKAAQLMRDIFQKAFGEIKMAAEEARISISNINPALEANTSQIVENAAATEGAAAAQQNNNETNLQEVVEVGKTTDSVNLMKDAYQETKTAVDSLNESLGSNPDKYLIEQQGNLQKATNQYKANEKERKKLVQENKNAAKEYKEDVARARRGYEAAITQDSLRSSAIADLNLAGTNEQMQLSFPGEGVIVDISETEKAIQDQMAVVKKELGIGYHETLENIKASYSKTWDVNDPFVENLDKEQIRLKKEIKEIQKNIEKYIEENPSTIKGVNIKEEAMPVDKEFWGKDSDIALSGVTKAKDTFSAFSKELTISNAMSGLVIGSMVSMGAQAIGLNSSLSGAIGTIAGVSKALSGMGAKGIVIGVAIGAIQYAMSKLLPSIDEINKKIVELQTENDEFTQKHTDIKSNLQSYKDLSDKIGKTEEETSQLKSSTEALVDLLPNAVSGYDSYGNAIINTSVAMRELETLQGKQAENAEKTLKQYGELQRGAQNTQKSITIVSTALGALLTVAGALGTVLSVPFTEGALTVPAAALTATGIAMMTGSAASAVEMTVSQKNENKKVIEENYNDIYSLMQTTEQTYLNKIASENQDTAKSIMDTLAISMLEAARTTGEVYADDMAEAFQEIIGQLDSSTIAKVNVALQGLDVTLDVKNMSYDEARKYIEDRVSEKLKDAGFTPEQLNSIIDVIVNIKFDAAIDVSAAKKEIDQAIQDTSDNSYKVDLDRYSDALGQLDKDTLQVMSNLGLLNSKFASVYTKLEDSKFNGQDFTSMFRDSSGAINDTTAALNIYEVTLGQIAKQEKILDYGSAYDYASVMAIQTEQALKATNLTWEEAFGKSKLDMLNEWGYEYERAGDALKYYQGVADSAYSMMSTKLLPTFGEVSQVIKDTADSFEQLSSVAEHLDLTGGAMDADALTGLFDLFSEFEEAATNSVEEWNAWAAALNAVNDGLGYENGMLQLNEEALSAVANMVEQSTKAKYKQMVADIESAQSSLRLQKQVLETEYNVVDQKIQSLEKAGEAKYNEANFEQDVTETLAANLDAINLGEVQSQEEKVSKILEINQAGFNQLLAMQQQFANGETANFTLKDYSDQYKNAVDKFKTERTDNIKELITDDYQTTLDSLRSYRDGLADQIGIIEGQIAQGDVEKTLFQAVIDGNVDLGKTFSETADQASDYAEQLEKVLTLLEKIDGIQHKITENEALKSLYDGYDGEAYARITVQNLDLAQEQYEVYKDLFDMQQDLTNQAAGNLLDSQYGSMFSISENGDIGWADSSMYDKYKSLPNDMQEDIDNLVSAFQEQRDALRDTEQELTVYAKAVKEAREEIVTLTIEAEDTILSAVKNREKILHEARVKALEDEVDMIEEAVDARKKARENQDDAKELAKSQEALRRATLDSSGKNNASLLQLQEDLENKQIDLSKKRFEQDMEDRTNWLNDTKDAETETYEYRLETMTWYWEEVQNIMETSTEEIMTFLMTWDETYRQASATQQNQLKEQWKFTFTELKSITQMLDDPINTLKAELSSTTAEVENMNVSIQALPGVWEKATTAANNYARAAKNASRYSGGGGYVSDNTADTSDSVKTPETDINEYIGWVGKTLEFRANNGKVDTYYSDGNKTGSKAKDPWGYDKNVKILGSKNLPNVGYSFLTDEWSGYIPVKYFYTTGIGGKKIGKSYKTGGMVDYTGPAWVDGTKSSPEAFLNSYQTQQVGALADALSNNSVSSVTGDSNITFGSISFNVASMSSSADGKAALETFVKGANDLMAKKGISTTLNLNVK